MFEKVQRRHKSEFAAPPRKRLAKLSACQQLPDVREYPDPAPATYFFALLGFMQQWRQQSLHCPELYCIKLAVHRLVTSTLRAELRAVRQLCGQGRQTVRPRRGLGVDEQGKLQVQGHVFGSQVLACLNLLLT